MKIVRLKVADLHEDPANVRRHPERNRAAIRASLAKFGQQRPIVVGPNDVVVAGNGTLAAARELGWDEIACVRTGLKGVDLVGFSLADNRSAELAEWDDSGLPETLRALRAEEFELAATGFSDEDMDELIAGLGMGTPGTEGGDVVDDPRAEWRGMPEYKHDDLTPFRTIIVHLKNQEDVLAFAGLVGQVITDRTKWLWYPQQERVPYGVVE